jgi:hypothetical protein
MKCEPTNNLVAAALEKLAAALEHGYSDAMTQYLRVMARFHRYSFTNILLICSQRPDATHVAGYRTWQKLGRQVRKGEKGIVIFAPMVRRAGMDARSLDVEKDGSGDDRLIRGFKAVRVFDIVQTDGEPLAEVPSLQGSPGEYLARLQAIVRGHGIELDYDCIPSGADGLSAGGRIVLSSDLPPAEEFAVLVYEFAHELLHHGQRRPDTTKSIRETEAEAVAFVVCQSIGLESTKRYVRA